MSTSLGLGADNLPRLSPRRREGIAGTTTTKGTFSGAWWLRCCREVGWPNEAIDTIYQAYGYKTSITQIIKKLQEDKKIITCSSSDFFHSHLVFPLR